MGEQVNALTYLGVPMIVVACALTLLFVLNIIGSILDIKGKVWPEIINFRGRLRRKREEKEKQAKLLEKLAAKLESFEGHYSPEKIAQRNEWMDWVNKRAEVYDASVIELTKFKESLEVTKELTLDLYININRNRIIDFANQVVNEDMPVSREAFNRIFKIYNEYEAILDKYGKTNGEVEVSIRIIRDAYEAHMRNHTFIEDARGY